MTEEDPGTCLHLCVRCTLYLSHVCPTPPPVPTAAATAPPPLATLCPHSHRFPRPGTCFHLLSLERACSPFKVQRKYFLFWDDFMTTPERITASSVPEVPQIPPGIRLITFTQGPLLKELSCLWIRAPLGWNLGTMSLSHFLSCGCWPITGVD